MTQEQLRRRVEMAKEDFIRFATLLAEDKIDSPMIDELLREQGISREEVGSWTDLLWYVVGGQSFYEGEEIRDCVEQLKDVASGLCFVDPSGMSNNDTLHFIDVFEVEEKITPLLELAGPTLFLVHSIQFDLDEGVSADGLPQYLFIVAEGGISKERLEESLGEAISAKTSWSHKGFDYTRLPGHDIGQLSCPVEVSHEEATAILNTIKLLSNL